MKTLSFVIATLLAFAVAAAAQADRITLRTSASVKAEAGVVKLRDIATLDGTHAEKHADAVIATITDPQRSLTLTLADVRTALGDSGVHWGRVHLSGRDVKVRPVGFRPPAPPAMTPVSLTRQPAPRIAAAPKRQRGPVEHPAASFIEQTTLRGELTRRMVEGLSISAHDLLLSFDDGDAATLAMSQDEFRFEIQPSSALTSERVSWLVRVWELQTLRGAHTITIRPKIRTAVVRMTETAPIGTSLAGGMIEEDEMWLSPPQAVDMVAAAQVTGRVASMRLHPGDLLRHRHVEQRMLVERRDVVVVRCLIGGGVITMQAVAQEDGQLNDFIEVRKQSERESFRAQVSGVREVILDLAATTTATSFSGS